MPTSREVNILVVEDDEIDVKALLRAFKKLKIANPVTIAKDGIEGWEALQDLPRPYLLILALLTRCWRTSQRNDDLNSNIALSPSSINYPRAVFFGGGASSSRPFMT